MNTKGFSNTMIVIIIAVILVGGGVYYFSMQEDNQATEIPETAYSCNSDADCVQYGTCSANCISRNWADSNPDNGPFCELLLPEFECGCVNNRCEIK